MKFCKKKTRKSMIVKLRVTESEKEQFYAICKKRSETPSEVIRRMMEKYTEVEE